MQQDSLGFLLADISRFMRKSFQQKLNNSVLTWAQARTLIYISRSEGVRQVDLAELLEVQPITLARLIDQLAELGLVERRPSPSDRRAYQIFMTESAQLHLDEIKKVANSIKKDALRGLNKDQADAISKALQRIRSNLAS